MDIDELIENSISEELKKLIDIKQQNEELLENMIKIHQLYKKTNYSINQQLMENQETIKNIQSTFMENNKMLKTILTNLYN